MENEALPEGWKTINITSIITNDQIYELVRLLRATPDSKRVAAIKDFFRPLKARLDEVGILPDYLAWALYSKFCNKTTLG